ncbi:MAG: HAMP domain-containing sensor histidine kinase [Alistipes sp.]|nr:HAMP domain-containing sensor histidine kinase [Alistipes sp.]
MKRGRFISLFVLAILSLALLAVVEVVWSVRSYREMRDGYNNQIVSIFDESMWRYAGNIEGSRNVTLGPLEGLYAIVSEQLRTSGIDTRYSVEMLLLVDGEPTLVSRHGDDTESLRKFSVEAQISSIIIRLVVEDPHTRILASMRGMIIISIIATLLLILTLIYLLVTLFRAKTLERIRRDLTHNITHELRTPIAAARAATEVLRSTPEIAQNEALREEYLAMTHSELDRLSVMVDSILRSSLDDESPVVLRPESVDLQSVVDEVVASLRLKYSSLQIDFSSTIAEGTSVWVDRASLRTIVLNLVDNSIKYSDGVPKILIKAVSTDEKVSFSVVDEGIGIAPSEQHRVFDKFYRISSAYRQDSQGYGLGLYHVRTLVERSGGDVKLESMPQRGTHITITLPKHG